MYRILFLIMTVLLTLPAGAANLCPAVMGGGSNVKSASLRKDLRKPRLVGSLDAFDPRSTPAWYAYLAKLGKHVDQYDPEFVKAGFVVKNGGLCGPTCKIGLMAAGAARQGKALRETPVQLMKSILDAYRTIMREDARYGTRGNGLRRAMEKAYQLPVYIQKFRYQDINAKALFDALNVGDGIVPIAALRIADGSLHEMVLLRVDMKRNLLTLSDPYYANDIYETGYFVDQEGHIHFNTLDTDAYPSQEVIIDEAELVTFPGKSKQIPKTD